MKTSRRGIYARLLSYTFQFRYALLMSVIGLAINAGMSSVMPILVQDLLDKGFGARDPEFIRWAPFLMAGVFFFRSIGGYLGTFYTGKVAALVVERLRNQMFDKMVVVPASFADVTTTGSLVAKFSYDVERVTNASSKSLTILVRDSFQVIFSFIVMLYLSWQLALVLLIIIPPIAVVVSLASKKFRKVGHRIQNSIGEITKHVEQSFSGLVVVKTFGRQEMESDRFAKLNVRNRKNQVKLVATKAINTPLVQLLVGVAFSLVIYIAYKPEWVGNLTAGQFSGFIAAVMMLLTGARHLTEVNEQLQIGIAGAESVFHLIDQPEEEDFGTISLEHCEGKVEFSDVYFKYQSDSREILRAISFSASPGQMVALVGRSGSGKTSLVRLLPRIYNATAGEIKIDGVPISAMSLKSLRHHIAIVSQDVLLFNDTVANNIRYAQPDATIEEITRACKAAHALEFIAQLPRGMDSLIGDKGVMLSGGQRQRIAIARALLKKARILILDEATSALDTETERLVQDALEHLMRERTTFVIAHRLSTVEKADYILVLDEGRIVERGVHRDLVEQGGLYAYLYQSKLDVKENTDDDSVELP